MEEERSRREEGGGGGLALCLGHLRIISLKSCQLLMGVLFVVVFCLFVCNILTMVQAICKFQNWINTELWIQTRDSDQEFYSSSTLLNRELYFDHNCKHSLNLKVCFSPCPAPGTPVRVQAGMN